MMGLQDFLGLGSKSETITSFIEKGAIIIDVRSVDEYKAGHIEGSKNIPLHIIPLQIEEIKAIKKPVITCCLSGMRSAQAASILKKNDIEVINGGGWKSLKSKL